KGVQVPLGFIKATIPSAVGAPIYKGNDLLTLSGISVNGGGLPAGGEKELHRVSYVGAADGTSPYPSNDAVLITRVALQADSGFTAYPLTDPVIVADTDG